jgi:hypothetical protein
MRSGRFLTVSFREESRGGFTSQLPVSRVKAITIKKVRMRSFYILSNMAVPALFRVLHVVDGLVL